MARCKSEVIIIPYDAYLGTLCGFNLIPNTFNPSIKITKQRRPLIAGHPLEEPLAIFVARGTDVQAKHDSMLVDICTFNEGLDSQIEECIVGLNTYDMSFDDDEPTVNCDDEDTECLLDQMYGNWGDELPGLMDEADAANGEKQKEEDEQQPKKPEVAPWSSRSSPSGTFVRDPATGKMMNIDA